MFQEIQRYCHNYSVQLPENMPKAALKSALFSFTASLFIFNLRGNKTVELARPLLAAGTAGLASLVHSLVIPLFNGLFDETDFSWKKFFFESMITLVTTQVFINALTPFEVNLVNTYSIFSKFVILPNRVLHASLQLNRNFIETMGRDNDTIDMIIDYLDLNLDENKSSIYLTV